MKHFSLTELCRSTTAEALKIRNEPNSVQIENLKLLVKYTLDPLRDCYGKPILVNSGFRSPAVNSAVGGVANSLHLLGRAADIRPADQKDLIYLFNLAKNLPHVELKIYKTFFHIAL